MMYNLSSRLTKSNLLVILRAIVASLDVWNIVRSMSTVTDGANQHQCKKSQPNRVKVCQQTYVQADLNLYLRYSEGRGGKPQLRRLSVQ